MMASQPTKVHDPMYAFDTHFPERLSRLHLHGDLSGSFRKKKGRAQRSGARYKTQPVTFDEIKEVDEEPTQASAEKKEPRPEHLKGQLQAFSRSMDGLVPKGVNTEHPPVHQHHISHSRSGSRKFQRHPDCIPERVDLEQQPPSPQPQTHQRLQEKPKLSEGPTTPPSGQQVKATPPTAATTTTTTTASLALPKASGDDGSAQGTSPVPSPNLGARRQKVTAKAKKRQKAQEDGDVS